MIRVRRLLLRAFGGFYNDIIGRRSRLGAAAVIFHPDGRLLLVRHTYGRRNWELPGGGRKANEVGRAGGAPRSPRRGPVLNDAGSFTPMASGRLVNTTVSAAWFLELTSIDPITVRVLQATNPWGKNGLTWQDPRVDSVELRDTTTRKEFRLPTDRPSIRLA